MLMLTSPLPSLVPFLMALVPTSAPCPFPLLHGPVSPRAEEGVPVPCPVDAEHREPVLVFQQNRQGLPQRRRVVSFPLLLCPRRRARPRRPLSTVDGRPCRPVTGDRILTAASLHPAAALLLSTGHMLAQSTPRFVPRHGLKVRIARPPPASASSLAADADDEQSVARSTLGASGSAIARLPFEHDGDDNRDLSCRRRCCFCWRPVDCCFVCCFVQWDRSRS